MIYAVISNSGKQYKVKVGSNVVLEKIDAKIGENIIFKKVLMLVDEDKVNIGKPFLKQSLVSGCVTKHGRLKKLYTVKFHRRKHYKKQQGHRQWFTNIKIIKINNNEG